MTRTSPSPRRPSRFCGTRSAPSWTGISSAAAASPRSRGASWAWPPKSTGADWLAAAIKAKAEIATAGGDPSHVALSPAVIGDLEDARDEPGHQLYPDASTVFAGLETF